MQEIKEKIIAELKNAGINADISMLEKPANLNLGDYALPCFSFAKELKKSPQEIAKEVQEKIKNKFTDFILKTEVKGPYINFFLKKELITEVLKEIHKCKQDYGTFALNKKIVLIEGPSPNTNKPLHLGHVRNMAICKSLFNVMNAAGYEAKQINMNNNRGVHICKSMLAYKKWGKDDTPEKSGLKSDHFIAKYYVLFNKKAKENPELEQEIHEMLKKWEEGDKEIIELWKKMDKWASDGFKETYKIFNMSFDKEYYESEYYSHGREIILAGLKKGIFEKDEDGAIIINLENEGLDKKVLLRADGTSVYVTQDIYLAKKKYKDFKYDKSIYVVGNEQTYHFQVLFKILKKLKFNSADGCYHFSYGMINLPEGRMKSREGTVVDADTLIEEVISLAVKEIQKRYVSLDKKEIAERAKKIAMAAILFFILKYDPKKDFTYNPAESLSFEGETGPYCQYVYARIQSIIRKSNVKAKENISFLGEEEKQILKLLSDYPAIVKKVSESYKLSLIARYVLELCQEFNNYYSKTKIIQEDKELESARLYFIEAIAQVIANALSLLGIEVLDVM